MITTPRTLICLNSLSALYTSKPVVKSPLGMRNARYSSGINTKELDDEVDEYYEIEEEEGVAVDMVADREAYLRDGKESNSSHQTL